MYTRSLHHALRVSSQGIRLSSTKTTRQSSLPAAYYRGGTSRAVFFKTSDLPASRSDWAPIFRGAIGSPDPYGRQLDGLGGGISSLSKVCVVGDSTHPDADVDYTFAALGIRDMDVDFSSNCGNMVSAVGPFAVDSGLFSADGKSGNGDGGADGDAKATVRIHNTNTGKVIHATFPVLDGEAATSGELAIDGVAGTAAPIQLDFINPAGSRTGKLLPTGGKKDILQGVEATCIDVANPCVFIKATDLGVPGTLTPDEITNTPGLLERLDSIRRQAGVKMGLADTFENVPGSVPKIGIVSTPTGKQEGKVDLVVRALSVGQPHKAVPITVALALATAARLEGSTVHEVTSEKKVDAAGITIGHASGSILVGATFGEKGGLEYATVFRTARRLFEGRVFWK
ncbi:PrpF protein [Aspergillus venezuelensis]